MNLNVLKSAAAIRVGRSALVVKKASPSILMAGGITGFVATTVLASRATLKLEPVLEKMNEEIALANRVREQRPDEYSEKEHLRDKTIIYTRGAFSMCKLYAPAIALGVTSVALLVSGQTILHRRNVGLAAAYKTAEEGFNAYRRKVVEEFGAEKDQELRVSSLEPVDVASSGVTEDDLEMPDRIDPTTVSSYARFFDEYNKNWNKVASYNLFFLKAQQNYLNDLLQSRGHVFLNEVYELLGFEHTSAGAVVGWTISKVGDNFIDFGIYDFGSEKSREFVNGQERSLLLDFNVDGVIYDKI